MLGYNNNKKDATDLYALVFCTVQNQVSGSILIQNQYSSLCILFCDSRHTTTTRYHTLWDVTVTFKSPALSTVEGNFNSEILNPLP